MKKHEKKGAELKKTPASPAGNLFILYAVGAAALAIGLYKAIDLRWVSDDAFITFRYVQNFVAGHGIVYNVGEYVEGYTHFLWLLVLSAAKVIGFDPVHASIWLGIASYAGILVLFIAISGRELRKNAVLPGKIFFLPLAAVLLALNYDMNVWASGGLETALYTFFLSLALYCRFYTDLSDTKKLLATGSILLGATLTRPDGALFILTALTLLVIQGIRSKDSLGTLGKKIIIFILPSLIIGIPYLLWKYNYYGDIFPSTYYAKSAGANYFGQGFFYIWLFFRVYFSAAIAIVILGAVLVLNKRRQVQNSATVDVPPSGHDGSPLLTVSTAVAVYLLFNVARVGGDFMFARFIIPVLPFLYFIIERMIERLPSSFNRYRIAIPLLLIASVFLENTLREKVLFHYDQKEGQLTGNWSDDGGGETRGIADERWVYYRPRINVGGVMRGSLDVYSEIGKCYEPFFRGLPITVAISGAENMIAYYANFKTVINEFGLTDTYIAHLPITRRGRIGHEKHAPASYLASRGAMFRLSTVVPKLPDQFYTDQAVFEIRDLGVFQIAKVITYDSAMMHELEKRYSAAGIDAVLPEYEAILPLYISGRMETLTAEQVEADYQGFKQVYFDKYPNPEMERTFQECIARKKREKASQ